MAITSEQYFYAFNGAVLKNKNDLLEFLKTVDSSTFKHHVNLEKNDFANWVEGILKEKRLAKKISQTNNLEEMINYISETIKQKDQKKMDKKSVITLLVNSING